MLQLESMVKSLLTIFSYKNRLHIGKNVFSSGIIKSHNSAGTVNGAHSNLQ